MANVMSTTNAELSSAELQEYFNFRKSKLPSTTKCDSTTDASKSQKSSSRDAPLQVSKTSSPRSIHSLLSGIAIPSLQEIAPDLRKMYLKELSSRRGSQFQDYKHFYTVQYQTVLINDFTTIAINLSNVGLGTAEGQRVSDVIKCHYLKVKCIHQRYPVANATVLFQHNLGTIGILRDKLPPTPGTAPVFFVQDANPPVSVSGVFSGLGLTQAQSMGAQSSIRNPNTAMDYHLYKIHHLEAGHVDVNGSANATALGQPSLYSHIHDWNIPLHDVHVQYQIAGAGTTAVSNALWLFAGATFTNAQQQAMGYVEYLTITTDLAFSDVPENT